MTQMAVAVLLVIGVLGFAFTSVGLLMNRDLFEQVHYLAPASLIGSVAVCAAVLLHSGFSQAGAKAILIALLLLVSSPVLSHAIARAGRIRRKQQLQPKGDEDIAIANSRDE